MQINYYSFGLNDRFDLITCLNLDYPFSVFCHSCSSLWKTSLCYQQENRSRKWCEVKEFYQCLPERNRTFFLTAGKNDQIYMKGRDMERDNIHRKWKENMDSLAPSLKPGFLAKGCFAITNSGGKHSLASNYS